MLTAKALIAGRSRGAACSPGFATGMFAAARLDIIRVVPTQRFKGTLQCRESPCREPFATMIIATVSKLPDQIFHNPSKISHLSPLHSVRVLFYPEERPARTARAPSHCNCRNEEKLWRRDPQEHKTSLAFFQAEANRGKCWWLMCWRLYFGTANKFCSSRQRG